MSIGKLYKANSTIIQDAIRKAKESGFSSLSDFEIRELAKIVAQASKIFKSEIEFGNKKLGYDEYIHLLVRATGLPKKYAVSAVKELLYAIKNIKTAIKNLLPFNFNKNKNIVLTPRGRVLSAILPSNLPTPNFFWLLSIPFRYPVVIRPSSFEPFTSYRMLKSLYYVDLPLDCSYFVPCENKLVPEIVFNSDLSLLFGSQETISEYQNYKNVKIYGPGNSKILIDSDYYNIDDIFERVRKSMLDKGGRSCLNASQVFVCGENAERLLKDLYFSLKETLPNHFDDPIEDTAEIPAFPEKEKAKKIASFLKQAINEDILVEVNDMTFLKPTVVLCEKYISSLFVELPFPYLAMTAVQKERVEKFLENSLVVSVFTEDQTLLKNLILNPTIKNVFLQTSTTDTDLLNPHEGNLAFFLCDFKSVQKRKN
ncbi:MAG: aldehyde dehydrogenase family protein [Nitrososphaeria archaeon]